MNLPFPISKIIYPFMKFLNRHRQGMVVSRPSSGTFKSNGLFHQFKIRSITGDEINFSALKGKKILLVNTASACGFTHQYAGLQKLYDQYKGTLHILAFPSNDFGEQEPGTAEEIADFCKQKYHITFPVTEKIKVTEPGIHPVYQWLSDKKQNGWNDAVPTWNFCKYLVDEDGELLALFPCKTDPQGQEITSILSPHSGS